MSLHIFANFVTPFGTANNNRGETEGNTTTLQKLLWKGETHTTVSAEAIRFAVRRLLAKHETTNRRWDENVRANFWEDWEFKGWASSDAKTYIDDDLLGFMTAEAAKDEGEGGDGKGSANVRRAVLEVTRAVSLTPWAGDTTFNAASPGATPSAAKADKRDGKAQGTKNPVPYSAEIHATRYQYGIALTPERLRDKTRAAKAIASLCSLGTVAGNHGRFLFDFSPEVVVFRLTDDPAPRILYCFDTDDAGRSVTAPTLFQRLSAGDIESTELLVGIADLDCPLARALRDKQVQVLGVRKAAEEAIKKFNAKLQPGG